MVRLFHREYECYISAEGSFAEDPPIVENGQWNGPPTFQIVLRRMFYTSQQTFNTYTIV